MCETFLIKARIKHNFRYDYSKVVYVNSHVPVIIICPSHGEFSQRPYAHLTQGCPRCGLINRRLGKTTAQFISESKWDYYYSITEYVNKKTPIKFICPEHGIVEQKPYQHLKNGCPFCSGRGINKHTIESFKEKAITVHGDIYDYSKVNFKSINDKVIIICPAHGEFAQKASNHINLANGCPKCKGGVRLTTEEYLGKAKEKHDDKFDYTDIDYTNSHDKLKFNCVKHGEFEQLAYMHLQTQHACPTCVASFTSSGMEKEIASLLLENYSEDICLHNRKLLEGKEIDIYLPGLKLGIEVNGDYWHCQDKVGINYHKTKADLADKVCINLIQIFEHEWRDKKDIVVSRLLNLLGKNKVIGARKTKVVELSSADKNVFLDRTHLQGRDNSSVHFGLTHEDKTVACMTFGKPRFSKKYEWELIRYCSELNVNVIGGASKLFNHFGKKSVISYADRRWSSGGVYGKLGFVLDGVTAPGYMYYSLKNKTIHNRMNFRKSLLTKMPGYDILLSESEIMKLNGYVRIWTAGNSRWIYV